MRAVVLAALVLLVGAALCDDPDLHRTVPEIIQAKGYPCEVHNVTTADGYILQVHRIPYGIAGPTTSPRPVVVFQHGLLDSSFTWVANYPNESAAYIFADAGYDVWLGNSRGNVYGRAHVDLSPSDPRFWAFSWDQMAQFDVPAKIDYAMQTNGHAKTVVWVGHSEGTQMMFAALSANATVRALVQPAVMLSPIAFLGNISSPELASASHDLSDSELSDIIGRNSSVLPLSWEDIVGSDFCTLFERVCDDLVCLMAGCDGPSSLNASRIAVIMAHFPAGSSAQNLIHYAQSVRTNHFQHYDYDSAAANAAHYQQPTPPPYSLADVGEDTFIVYGGRDKMADPIDVAHLLRELPPPRWTLEIADFGHGDPVWSLLAADLIYRPLLSQLAVYARQRQ